MKTTLAFFILIAGLMFPQSLGGRHIIIAYDISGSMQTVGMNNPSKIKEINDFLLSRLTDQTLLSGSAKTVQTPGTVLTQPLLRGGR